MTDRDFTKPPTVQLEYVPLLPQGESHRKWKTGSIVFGVIAVAVGSLCLCAGVALLTFLISRFGVPANQFFVAFFCEVVPSMVLIILGIGAIRMKRWVRPLMLATGWAAIVPGIFSIAYLLVSWHFQSGFFRRADFPLDINDLLGPLVFGLIVLTVLGVYVWYFQKQAVKDSLEFYDPGDFYNPKPCWAYRCPIPLIIMALAIFLYGLFGTLAFPDDIVPAFGTMLRGSPAIVYEMAIAAIATILAWLVLHRYSAGWWGTLLFILLASIPYEMTILKSSESIEIASNELTAQEVFTFQRIDWPNPIVMGLVQLPFFILVIIYLFYVRRYFAKKSIESQ